MFFPVIFLSFEQTLIPTWPVVITLCDVLLKNRIPMEMGLQYSWRYWKSVQELNVESNSPNFPGETIINELENIETVPEIDLDDKTI